MQHENTASLSSATSNGATLKATTFDSLKTVIIATKYYCYYCFTAAHQSEQYIMR